VWLHVPVHREERGTVGEEVEERAGRGGSGKVEERAGRGGQWERLRREQGEGAVGR